MIQKDLFPIWEEVFFVFVLLFYLPEADFFHNLRQRLVCNVGGFLSAFFSALFNICLILHYFIEPVLNRLYVGYNAFGDGSFKIAVSLAVKLGFDFVKALACAAGINTHKIVDSVLAVGIVYPRLGISYRRLEFFHNIIGLVKNLDRRFGIGIGL